MNLRFSEINFYLFVLFMEIEVIFLSLRILDFNILANNSLCSLYNIEKIGGKLHWRGESLLGCSLINCKW